MDLLDITEPDIRAELLRLESERLERRLKRLECIRKAYDAIAQHLVDSGMPLTHDELYVRIPAIVLAAAVEFGWTGDPGKRVESRKRPVYNSATDGYYYMSEHVVVAVPEPELTEQVGRFRTTTSYPGWWLQKLGGRVAFWEAEALKPSSVPPVRANRGKKGGTGKRGRRTATPKLTEAERRARPEWPEGGRPLPASSVILKVSRSMGSDAAVQALLALKTRKGWTMEELAGHLGTTARTLQNFIKWRTVRSSLFRTMAKRLDISPEDLLGGNVPSVK